MPALNNVITATITLYKIEEVSIYQSELISTNGNIFHPYDVNTQLDFKIYSNDLDITNQFTDIEWVKISQDANEIISDMDWGVKYQGLSSISITKEDVNKKCVIQANAYMIKKNERVCVASSRVTLIDVNELYANEQPPENPTDGFLWINTKYDPPIIYSWSSALNKWIEVGKTTPFIRNLIHNSNFWKLNTEYFIEDNSESLERITIEQFSDKNWAKLKTKTVTNDVVSAGLMQTTTYPIVKNSDYSFSFLVYRPDVLYYNGEYIYCKIFSIDSEGEVTAISTNFISFTAGQEVQKTVIFKTLNNTNAIRIFIGIEPGKTCEYYITELSLYNTDGFYTWELSPEDVQEQLANKLDSDHLSVFNALTRNGVMEGIYINKDVNGKEHYYFNASHIKTGSLDGGLINGIGLNIKDEVTGDSIFHVYKDENGTHIDMIANNLYIGQTREEASTISYVNTSVQTAETNAIASAGSYTDGKIVEVNEEVDKKADITTVDDLENRVSSIENITEDDAIIGTVTNSAIYIKMQQDIDKNFLEHEGWIRDLDYEINNVQSEIKDSIKPSITSSNIINTVRNSQDYKNDLNLKLNTSDFNTYKNDNSEYLDNTFSSIDSKINRKADEEVVNGINTRVNILENNTKASAIINTVRSSTEYLTDLNNKLNTSAFTEHTTVMEKELSNMVKTNNIISKINTSNESEKIKKSKIDFGSSLLPMENLYFDTIYTKNGIHITNAPVNGTYGVNDLLDRITIDVNNLDITLQVNDIKNSNYVKVSEDNANIYMNNNEIIKLLLYEIKNLKARVFELENKNNGGGSSEPTPGPTT